VGHNSQERRERKGQNSLLTGEMAARESKHTPAADAEGSQKQHLGILKEIVCHPLRGEVGGGKTTAQKKKFAAGRGGLSRIRAKGGVKTQLKKARK